jgi:threonine aldolase
MHLAMRRLELEPSRLGDDVFGEDATVLALEACAAGLFGKEAGLFVPSGTMGNLLAILAHTRGAFGAEYIVGDQQHTYLYEQGNTASVARCHARVVPNLTDGTLCLDAVRAAVQPDDPHYGATKLVSCENTHNMCGGVPLPIAFMDSMGALCRERGLAFHVDGARVLNACAALGETPARVCRDVDSVSVCLSKGLAAPVGSVVVGAQDVIDRCRRYRKALGGGMRQAGVLAACGLVALREERLRLGEDHATLRALVAGLAGIHPAIHADVGKCHTNIAFFGVDGGRAGQLCAQLEADFGVRMGAKTDAVVRAVTHREVGEKEVEMALDAVRKVTAEW